MSAVTDLARRLWREFPLYLYVAACAVVCLALWAAHGVQYDHSETALSFTVFYISALLMFFVDIVWRLLRDRPERPLSWARRRYFSRDTAKAVAGGLPAIAICVAMIPLFSSMKSMIPLFKAYSWDATFIAWDRAIFFGYDAWQVLQPLLGYPVVTATIALAYHVWVLFLYPGCIYFAFYGAPSDDLRRRFFLAYALCWSVVGGFLATMFASVGPVFAEPLLGVDTFAPQMDYLRAANTQVPVMTLPVQDMLLEGYHNAERGLGSGITAMPSMHVAIAALFWLATREISPRAGRFFFGFLVLIWVGSVHTAYHYAVDGLVSLVAVWLIWKAVPYVFARWDALHPPRRQAALRTNTVPAE